MKATAIVPTEDPFFFDQERLQAITDRKIVSHGLEDHRENRVMEIDQEQDLLWGLVEGSDPEIPNDVSTGSAEVKFVRSIGHIKTSYSSYQLKNIRILMICIDNPHGTM